MKRKHLVAIVGAIWLVAFVTVTNAPEDVLSRSSVAKSYVQLMSWMLPLDQYARLSSFPDLTKLYHAIIWWTFPLLFVLFLGYWRNARSGPLARPAETVRVVHRIGYGLAALLLLVLGVGSYAFNQGQDTRLFAFGTSREEFALLGILLPVAAAAFVSGGIAYIKKMITTRA